jgi:hypothetical protein
MSAADAAEGSTRADHDHEELSFDPA